MPTYEYKCRNCGENFEVFVKSSEKGKVRCPQCDGRKLQEIFKINTIGVSAGASACSSCSTEKSCSSCGMAH